MASRLEKEAFVAHLNGSDLYQVYYIIICGVLQILIWKLIANRTYYVLEYCFLIIPMILSVTLLCDFLPYVILFQLVVILAAQPAAGPLNAAKIKKFRKNVKQETFITETRSALNLITCLSILAVDFPAFPRRLAKTETFGISLMDAGVGVYIFSSGIVSGPRLGKHVSVYKTLKIAFPALVLGMARAIITEAVDYQKHVTEYGVHWNFFITLGMLPIVVALQTKFLPRLSFLFCGLVASAFYQYFLLYRNLEDYILYSPRVGFISMNREGIFSLVGYYSIFLISANISRLILSETATFETRIRILLGYYFSASGLYHLMTEILGWKASRRMANFPFVLFSLMCGLICLIGLLLIEFYIKDHKVSVLLRAVNRNQLILFLIANLMTGGVNLILNTLETSDYAAVGILSLYMFLYGLAATALDFFNITIKI